MRSLLVSFIPLVFVLGACGGAVQDSGNDASANDGGADGSKQDSGPVACDGKTCGAGEACVVLTSSGGACELPDDAGVCPDGTHTTSCCDNTTVGYTCAKIPDGCNGALGCPCAESLCQCGGCAVADAGVLACACEYP